MTDTFAALSDPTRRLLLDRLSEQGGLTLSARLDLPMTRQAVAKHLAVLEAAELAPPSATGAASGTISTRCRSRKWRGGGWAGSRKPAGRDGGSQSGYERCWRANSGSRRIGSFIADHLEFDPVPVEEIEPPPGFVIVMPEGFEPVFSHDFSAASRSSTVKAIWLSTVLGELALHAIAGIESDVIVLGTDMDRAPVFERRPAPAFLPAEQVREQRGAAFGS